MKAICTDVPVGNYAAQYKSPYFYLNARMSKQTSTNVPNIQFRKKIAEADIVCEVKFIPPYA